MDILLRNGANINEKDVRNTTVGETDDFEEEREGAEGVRQREQREQRRV